ncbi:MAG: carbohydrate kinase, partial [Clostridiales bacterium]|nr:carbohydrate kinase [Clostridiales bacterium]
MKYLIGMDVGTSRIKAVLFDLEGNEQKIAYRDNEPIYEGSHSEQDMNMVWDKSLACLKEVVEGVDKDSILGIGVTGQGEGCWLIDKDGKPVSNAILWNDGRAKDLVDEINSNKELSELIYKTTGTPVLTGTALTLLKWSKENRKEVLDRADKLFFCKDWVRYNLTGEKNLELTDTATSLMNVQTKEFAYELLDALELGEYKHLLSPAIKPYEVAATITDEIAEITGLNKDTPVIGGAIDVMATVLGAGAINNGDTCSILGTTCATMIVSETCEPGKENTRFELHPIDDLYVNLQPTMSGTPNIDWVVDNISDTRVYKEIDEKIKD